MNIFNQYGIKEVADVTLYSIELDENDDDDEMDPEEDTYL